MKIFKEYEHIDWLRAKILQCSAHNQLKYTKKKEDKLIIIPENIGTVEYTK
jgi:hypothetical protein